MEKKLDKAAVKAVKEMVAAGLNKSVDIAAKLNELGYVSKIGGPINNGAVTYLARKNRIKLWKSHPRKSKIKYKRAYKKASSPAPVAEKQVASIKAAAPKSTLLGDIEEIMTSCLAEGIKSRLIVTLVKQQYS